MGKLDGRTAFITGLARGQGRSHALTLAQEGADIIGVDLCRQLPTVSYPMPTPDDLAETVRLVEQLDRRIVVTEADVRDQDALRKGLEIGLERFGGLDIVVANAGIMAHSMPPHSETRSNWDDSIAVMLTGVWNTLQVTVPTLKDQGRGGSIVLTSSSVGIRPAPTDMSGGFDGYIAAKFGVVGLMQSYAMELAEYSIRVNTVHPTGVATPMVVNDFFGPYMQANPKIVAGSTNKLPVPMVEPADVSRLILFLVSDDGRYITGTQHRVDAGVCL
jgi:SDR family mycofactocin-dependent oxidoreductase